MIGAIFTYAICDELAQDSQWEYNAPRFVSFAGVDRPGFYV